MTRSPASFDSWVMMSSVIPSLKYSFSGSVLRLAKGSTATALSRTIDVGASCVAGRVSGVGAWPRSPPGHRGFKASTNAAALSKRLSGFRSIARRTARSMVEEEVQPAPLSVGVGRE